MQACGVSLMRLLRPVGLLSILAWGSTIYILIVSVPDANQRFREITFGDRRGARGGRGSPARLLRGLSRRRALRA